jgi:hypothetical protein
MSAFCEEVRESVRDDASFCFDDDVDEGRGVGLDDDRDDEAEGVPFFMIV